MGFMEHGGERKMGSMEHGGERKMGFVEHEGERKMGFVEHGGGSIVVVVTQINRLQLNKTKQAFSNYLSMAPVNSKRKFFFFS